MERKTNSFDLHELKYWYQQTTITLSLPLTMTYYFIEDIT